MNEMDQPTAFCRTRMMRLFEFMDTSNPRQDVNQIMQAVD